MAGTADGAVDIGAAIQRGVELLSQQSVETPAFQLRNTFDLVDIDGSGPAPTRAPSETPRSLLIEGGGRVASREAVVTAY